MREREILDTLFWSEDKEREREEKEEERGALGESGLGVEEQRERGGKAPLVVDHLSSQSQGWGGRREGAGPLIKTFPADSPIREQGAHPSRDWGLLPVGAWDWITKIGRAHV